ncbi:hypothetical protein HY988_04760 [Candidatus Micrarchaeota archaeon]|nr:hypothetical protein [Candidatus Micrarchaeota archaeon]
MPSHKRPQLTAAHQANQQFDQGAPRLFYKSLGAICLAASLAIAGCATTQLDGSSKIVCAYPRFGNKSELRNWPNVLVFDINGEPINYDEGAKPGRIRIDRSSSGLLNFIERYAKGKCVLLVFGETSKYERRYLNSLALKLPDRLIVVSLSILPNHQSPKDLTASATVEFQNNRYLKLIIPEGALSVLVNNISLPYAPNISQPFHILLDPAGGISSVSYGIINSEFFRTWSLLLRAENIPK